MAKSENIKTSSKPSPPPSDESEMDSSDESSDEEVNQLISEMDKQSRDFMAKLVVELEKTQDILTFERSELEALRLEVSQAKSIIATLKEDLASSQAQCNSLKSRNEELEEQYSLLWSSTSHSLKVKGDSSASTSKGYDRCCNIDLESYATNLANMESMKKEIARLNSIIARGCMNERVKFKEGKMPENLDGLSHHRSGKTGQRDTIKGQECIKFVSNGELKEDEYMPSAQSPEVSRSKPRGSGVWKPCATQIGEPGGSGKTSGGSGSAKIEPRSKARLNTSKFPRHLTLVCRFTTIQ
jgi:hypothetical protein